MTLPRLVYVRWHDAIHPSDEWAFTADIAPDPDMLAETVGWLVSETKRSIQVSVTCAGRGTSDEQYTGTMTIPRGCVEIIANLTVPVSTSKPKIRAKARR